MIDLQVPGGEPGIVVCFGEMMTRLSTPGHARLRQCLPGTLEAGFAGAESNIASAVALLGGRSRFVTALPAHALGEACVTHLRGCDVDTSCVLRTQRGRLAQYFIETGAGQRPGRVLYDREFSAFSITPGDAYDWDAALAGASWLVLTGVSPALSEVAASATLHAARAARERGVRVCCDLNFRATLWNWEAGTPARALAQRVMSGIMPYVDLLLTNPDQAQDVLGLATGPGPNPAASPSPTAALDNASAKPPSPPPEMAPLLAGVRRIARSYPQLQLISFTLRESISASHNNLGGMLYDVAGDRAWMAPLVAGNYVPYAMHQIVDRLGAGDAFAGALLYALQSPELASPAKALEFAVAAGCLAHTIPGDINFVTREEVEALCSGDRTGRVVR
ncbi:sugar kinase [Verrucomicrobia bacterium LW23]|nr:sugar kinase [Verrucomicrobia bacterium LW23]